MGTYPMNGLVNHCNPRLLVMAPNIHLTGNPHACNPMPVPPTVNLSPETARANPEGVVLVVKGKGAGGVWGADCKHA